MNEITGIEAWAFKIAMPIVGAVLTLLFGIIGAILWWIWNRTSDNLARLQAKDEEQQTAITKLELRVEALSETSRSKDVVSREVLDLTIKPVTDRLDALDEHMTEQTKLSREQNELMRALVQQNPGLAGRHGR
jgi:hypothetical protein